MTLINTFLIPFFLAGHMVSDKEWENGPKYVFKAETNVTMSGRNFDLDEIFTHFHTYMICCPKAPDTLNCHFSDGIMMSTRSSSNRLILQDFNMTKEPFEVKFNDLGAESMTVNKDLDDEMIGIMKIYVKQLTVGADLSDKTENEQFEMPKSSVEECKANMKYRYNTEMSNSLTYDDDRSSHNNFELRGLPRLHKPDDKSIEVTKDTPVDECKMKHIFDFDGVFYGFNSTDHSDKVSEKLEEMKCDMAVSNTGFWSNTMKSGVISTKTHDEQLNYKESVALTLVDMLESEYELPTVSDPKTIKMLDEQLTQL